MKVTDDIVRTLGLVSTGIGTLEAIADVARGARGGTATQVLQVLDAIIVAAETVLRGLSGEVTPEQANEALATLRDRIASNDATIDDTINAKFAP